MEYKKLKSKQKDPKRSPREMNKTRKTPDTFVSLLKKYGQRK